jgi:rubrerythrin
MYIALRRLKAGRLARAKNRVKELTRDLASYDAQLADRGIEVVPCDHCSQLNWICDDCGVMTCRTECPRCGGTNERIGGR